jgi:hypothetical protein
LTVLLLTIGNLIWSSMTEIKWLTCGDKTVLHVYKLQKVTSKMGRVGVMRKALNSEPFPRILSCDVTVTIRDEIVTKKGLQTTKTTV